MLKKKHAVQSHINYFSEYVKNTNETRSIRYLQKLNDQNNLLNKRIDELCSKSYTASKV